jgi:hypothetical protein
MSDALSSNRILTGLAKRFASAGRSFLSRGLGTDAFTVGPMPRVALLVAIALSVTGCGRDKPQVSAGQTLSAEEVKQKCADPEWREKNLGIWYAVCRQPAAW